MSDDREIYFSLQGYKFNVKDYSCNFKLKDSDKRALVKCPECHGENYACNVLSGICTWCGFDINGDDIEHEDVVEK